MDLVAVSCRHEAAHEVADYTRVRARRILRALGLRRRPLSVSLVGDEEMRRLNRRYRGRNRATDVLSFALDEGPFGSLSHGMLGDVVISMETALRLARRRRRAFREVIEELLLHGILHLAGYDHERSREDACKMRLKELEVKRALGSHRLGTGTRGRGGSSEGRSRRLC